MFSHLFRLFGSQTIKITKTLVEEAEGVHLTRFFLLQKPKLQLWSHMVQTVWGNLEKSIGLKPYLCHVVINITISFWANI